jgi:hypothetical protein
MGEIVNDTISYIPVEQIEFVKELYPRLREDDAAIERYRAALDKLPPIAVARGRLLVDGFHRWQAHRREGVSEIAVIDLGNLADIEIRRESIIRNAAHGHQLSARDKQRLAGILWRDLSESNNGNRLVEIADLLSVSRDSVERWTKDARVNELTEKQARAWNLWLECKNDSQIGRELSVDSETAKTLRSDFSASADFSEPPPSRQHFDIWQFPKSDSESSYFGAMPPQIVENLLWFYTEPGQIVFDPFAGSGTTIDVAKRMGRRVWASDLNPATPTLPIHQHDIATGWPKTAPAKASLILLDPPYWKQAAGRYSESAADLGNMTLEDFSLAWSATVKHCVKHLDDDGRLAFIVSPAEDKEADRVVDLALLMYGACVQSGLKVRRRVIVPYQTQQATGQQVEWARKERKLLKLYRDLVVMEK